MRIAIAKIMLIAVSTLWTVTACMSITTPRAVDPLTYDIIAQP